MVKVNGSYLSEDGRTVSEYLTSAGYSGNRIVVEYNGTILLHSEYELTVLNDGDVLEIVSFVGGG